MVLLVFTALLWGVVAVLGVLAARRGSDVFWGGARDTARELRFIAPRLALGVIGAGFVAELLPSETVKAWLGAESGTLGILIAALVGGALPGGPVLVFAVAGAALGAGAGAPQILAFVTAWLLYSINRGLVWETPMLGFAYARDRMLIAAPIPFAIGHLALLVGV